MTEILTYNFILVKILKNIFTTCILMQNLAFTGDTAARLFYNLTCFSVELDFDLLEPEKEEYVFNAINDILSEFGHVKAQNKRYSLFFLLSYKDKLEHAQNIKVEINKRPFGSKYEIKNFLGISMVMVQEDMFADKLVTMHERVGKTNRDIYDVWFFFHNNWPINKQIIEQRTNMSYKDFLQICINDLEKMSNRNILSGIGELLDDKQKAWAKTHLIPETLFYLKLALSNEK